MLNILSSLPLATPPWTGLGKRLESACRKALYDYQMVEGVHKIAIALSGGKDSLSLLYLLKAITGRGFPPFEIVAIHVDGEFSCGAGVDRTFLKGICEKLGVELIVRTSTQKRETLECYSCSRERRRLIFEAAKEHGATTIAFGHHQDDNVQTALLNLFHKGEFAGILPKLHMVDYGVTLIRPLILIEERALIEFSKAYGFSRITCQCPVGQNSMRKKVEILLRDWEDLFPHARTNLADAIRHYGSDKAIYKEKL